jgi:thioesterase domain-containing protein
MPHTANGVAKPAAEEVFVLPTTVRQRGFWYLDQLQPGNPAYNIAVRFRLQGPLRPDMLEQALNEIVRRHESLRTVLAVMDGVPVQMIAPRLSIALQREDLRGDTEPERDDQARTAALEEARRPFDITKGPLIRARLVRFDAEEHVLLVTTHHIVADGWSVGVLTQELGALYDAFCRGVQSPLPELAIQWGDFAIWEEERLKSKHLDQQIAYWVRQLANLPRLEIPTDWQRPAVQSFQGAIESLLLPRELTNALDSLSNLHRVTPFMLMLAAVQLLLQQNTGQTDVFVGSVLAGRSRVELEPLIGLFINPLVFRTDLSGDPPFPGLLARVRETVLQAIAHQDVPFERVVEAIGAKRDPSRHPVFQINYLFQRDFVRPFQAAGLTLTAIPSVSPGSIYDLNFFMVERAEGWRASCEFNSALYRHSTVRRLLGQYHSLLEEIAANPDRRISEFVLAARTVREPVDQTADQPTQNGALASAAPVLAGYLEPRDHVESQLAAMWRRLLGVARISITSDFFDAGGHSLLAARLLADVDKAFRRKVPLSAFLQAPTIEALAARLRLDKPGDSFGQVHPSHLGNQKWVDPDSQVFPMRLKGTKPPLMLIDAGPFHRPLVRAMGDDHPVFGIALPELAALPERATLTDIAANLVAALLKSPIAGPYYLAGWSLAGVIGYEMTRQLRSHGKEVARLILLDTNNPEYLRRFREWKRLPIRLFFLLEKVFYQLRKVRGLPLRDAWRFFWNGMQRFRMDSIGRQPEVEEPTEDLADHPFGLSWRVQYAAAANYRPEPIDTPLVLIRSAVLQTGLFRDPQLGWGPVARGGLQVFEMPGEHDAMFKEPDVQRLASTLSKCLQGPGTTVP